MARRLLPLLLAAVATAAGAQTQPPSHVKPAGAEELFVTSGAPGKRGGTLYLASVGAPHTLNPLIGSTVTEMRVVEALNAALVGYDAAEQTAADGLAKSYTVSDDGLVWTFQLRRGLRWSDGHPFDADDAVFSFRVALDPSNDGSTRSAFEQSDGSYPKVEKVDAYAVRLTLAEPNALTLSNVSIVYMLPRHKLSTAFEQGTVSSQLGVDTNPKDVVGLGPFRLKEVVDDRVVLERNPYYWKQDRAGQRLPYLDEAVFRIVPDLNAAELEFLSGRTDAHVVRTEDHDRLKAGEAARGYKVHDLGPGVHVTYLLFNRADPKATATPREAARLRWFSSEKFRQAISYAVDRERLARELYGGRAETVSTFVPSGNRLWHDPAAIARYPRDLQRAKRLLAEIGIEDRNGDGLLEDTAGNRIEFTIRTNSNNPTRVATIMSIAKDLEEIGITATSEAVPFAAMIEMLQDSYDYDAVVAGWQSGNPPDPILMKKIILSSGPLHYGRPRQPEPATAWERKIDELMHRNQRTLDLPTRQRQFSEILRLWSENLPEIDLLAPHYVVAIRNRVGNFEPAVVGTVEWNLDELYVTGPPPAPEPRDVDRQRVARR